tara:strand:- start:19 stop:513 length:495 start_codon:yes stop_codon:yes gene_type:complete
MRRNIFISVGSNIPKDKSLSLIDNCKKAINSLKKYNIFLVRVSNWYKTEPIPVSGQPWFVNSVIEIKTMLTSKQTLNSLHEIESSYGRIRAQKNESRTLDLDIIDFNNEISNFSPILPHPRMHKRLFVLYPLVELSPNWVHPILNQNINTLINNISYKQKIQRL